MAQGSVDMKVVNMVAEGRLGSALDTRALLGVLERARPAMEGSLAVVVDLGGGAAAVLFADGRARIAGARTGAHLAQLAKTLIGVLKSAGAEVPARVRFDAVSCSASWDGGRAVDVDALPYTGAFSRARRLPPGATGALAVRWDESGGDVLVFPGGAVVVHGARTAADARRSMESVKKGLDELE